MLNRMKSIIYASIGLVTLTSLIFAVGRFKRIVDLNATEEKEVYVFSENNYWKTVTELNIFGRKGESKIIKPGSKGIYKFSINNNSGNKMKYVITLTDESNTLVNMKYKLRLESDYIANKENVWKKINDTTTSKEIDPFSKDVYVLDWTWEDSDNDTSTGLESGYYTLTLTVNGELTE